MEDVLSDVFGLIRLKSCVYFMQDFHAPWAMRIGGGGVANFHVVMRGDGVAEVDEQSFAMSGGDVLLFPHGSAHVLADRAAREPVDGMAVLNAFNEGRPLFADGESATRLVCGHFEYDNEIRHPLIDELPETIQVNSFGSTGSNGLNDVLSILMREMTAAQPGARIIVERLAEVLLVQTLRAHFEQASHPRGFLAAASDDRLARAIRLIHSEADRSITLDDLARAAGMSRSAFALHFKSVSNASPIAYLTRWRMLMARELLTSGRASVADIANRSGYDSDVSFSRAFKRVHGVSPAQARRDSAGAS